MIEVPFQSQECVQYASQRGMRGMNNPQHKLLTVKLTREIFS